MRQQAKWMLMSVCALPLVGLWAATANAQQKMEVKEKAPMYSYIVNWEVSRDKFKDLESQLGTNNALMAKQLADGSLIGPRIRDPEKRTSQGAALYRKN